MQIWKIQRKPTIWKCVAEKSDLQMCQTNKYISSNKITRHNLVTKLTFNLH